MGTKHGSRVGRTGRSPEWFRQWCAEAASKPHRLKWIEEILDGKTCVNRINIQGQQYESPPTFDERLNVYKFVVERGYGKPPQAVELTGQGGGEIKIKMVNFDGNFNPV